VIVPVKGPEEGLQENLASLAAQDYPDYELLVVARDTSDIPQGAVPVGARAVLSGEGDGRAGEKIQNLLAGVAAARASSEVFAFADSDGRVGKRWLRALVARLGSERVGASTGYRWHLPDPPDFWSLMRSVWNAVIAGRFGPGPNSFAWGGAMAIRRETFFHCRVPDFWRGSVSDDYSLSAAVRHAGLEIHYAPGALLVSTDHTSAAEFLRWIRRQMVITRVYRPRLWWQGLLSHVIYCGAMVVCVAEAFRGHLLGEYALVALLGLGMLKGSNRASLAKAALPEYEQWFKRHGWVHTWWVPLATWVWMYSLLASAFTNVIEWRGNRYRLGRKGVEKL
jgi:GT2 family glycosyltransferase